MSVLGTSDESRCLFSLETLAAESECVPSLTIRKMGKRSESDMAHLVRSGRGRNLSFIPRERGGFGVREAH